MPKKKVGLSVKLAALLEKYNIAHKRVAKAESVFMAARAALDRALAGRAKAYTAWKNAGLPVKKKKVVGVGWNGKPIVKEG